ncbi:hypothetical protein SPRG_09145 [Saprolegnia parasitica CBS 223.65]|uniref:Uncharacterized protein n=1 Tax=Saprolegnia parasitica (strain CBS 223.65) TaxID=695850 RepID=A0A067C828_SAPPC|nr:hypothetical protein SPRG_09145 [Saprolegnia parasitica CBS 223.65]KDO25315.1 hypothetical protein SPRG_09145 [Saprolegnia parasitica CBS 223.65]|eukprot:XP_012203973.1 hypothetical protein SPRG_09145 [Saprolegnia parasitica CBS 223.65]
MHSSVNSASEKITAVASATAQVVVAPVVQSAPPPLGAKDADDVVGGPFFAALAYRQDQVHTGHKALLMSGEKLSAKLAATRRRVAEEAHSALYIQHNFGSLTQIADDVRSIRNTIQALVLAFEDAEQHLMMRTEDHLTHANAHFASQQQTELEQYEHTLLVQKDLRTRQRQEERRRALGDAFEKDLKTYQALMTYQGHAPTRLMDDTEAIQRARLESIELVVEPDVDLTTFYNGDDDLGVPRPRQLSEDDGDDD